MAMPPFPFDAVNDFFSQLSLPISLCLLFAIDKKKHRYHRSKRVIKSGETAFHVINCSSNNNNSVNN